MKTTDAILAGIKAILGTTYTVLESYDATQEVDTDGAIAINLQQMENLLHTGCSDYKITVAVNGQTIATEDKAKTVINAMLNYCLNCLTQQALKNITGADVAGAIVTDAQSVSDGDTNNFSISIELYVENLIFA